MILFYRWKNITWGYCLWDSFVIAFCDWCNLCCQLWLYESWLFILQNRCKSNNVCRLCLPRIFASIEPLHFKYAKIILIPQGHLCLLISILATYLCNNYYNCWKYILRFWNRNDWFLWNWKWSFHEVKNCNLCSKLIYLW